MLSLIPTPIGNLEDITFRAITVLKNVDLLLVEDTRVTGKLLNHFGIKKTMVAFHTFNEHQRLESIINELNLGKHIGMVSDAGTPGISDPGFLIVRECIKNDITVESLPGPTAFVPALTVSGFPLDEFLYVGFLPRKKGRKTKLEQLSNYNTTIVLYESPFRVVKTLEDILLYFGDRNLSVSREISKKFEETVRGTTKELIEFFTNKAPKGEFVICIAPLDA